jgi:hypothetical protein
MRTFEATWNLKKKQSNNAVQPKLLKLCCFYVPMVSFVSEDARVYEVEATQAIALAAATTAATATGSMVSRRSMSKGQGHRE